MTQISRFLLPAALLAGAPLAAQDGADPNDIVVEGAREVDRGEVKSQARDITAGNNLRRQPLSRFESPVCPGVIGLPVDLAWPLIERIRAVALAAGLDLADSKACRPNVVVAFADDGQAELAEFDRRGDSILQALSDLDRKSLLAESGPARAFSITAKKSNDGMPLVDNPPVVAVTMTSRLFLSYRTDIEMSVVVIDADAADGLSIIQLADYSAMRALAKTRAPDGDTAYGTILALFDPEALPPAEMTDFDRAYLKSVYSDRANKPGQTKLGAVGRLMESETAKE
jgi:hypothetical protein